MNKKKEKKEGKERERKRERGEKGGRVREGGRERKKEIIRTHICRRLNEPRVFCQ